MSVIHLSALVVLLDLVATIVVSSFLKTLPVKLGSKLLTLLGPRRITLQGCAEYEPMFVAYSTLYDWRVAPTPYLDMMLGGKSVPSQERDASLINMRLFIAVL
jgi:hypothetical protein